MKIPLKMAAEAASYRVNYLKELSLYLDLPVLKALDLSIKRFIDGDLVCDGVTLPNNYKGLTEYKVQKILSGSHDCRAYLAQIALTVCLEEGYSPYEKHELKMLACMLLVRYSVTCIEDAFKLIPDSWGNEQKTKFKDVLHLVLRE